MAKKEKTPAQKVGWYKRDLKMLWNRSPMKWECYSRAKLRPSYIKCEKCGNETYWKLSETDHVNPVVPVAPDKLDQLFPGADYDVAKYAFRLNVPGKDLQQLCEGCHKPKSKAENAGRKRGGGKNG